MPCKLTRTVENNSFVFRAPTDSEVTVMVRGAEGANPPVRAAILAARYNGEDLTVADLTTVTFTVVEGLEFLSMLVESAPPRSPVEICEVCEPDPLSVNVLDTFITQEPPQARRIQIRGI